MIDTRKTEIRKIIREKKKQFSLAEKKEKSEVIFNQIESLEQFRSANTIMAYWSMDDEVHTHDLILKFLGKKQIILPVVKGDVLELKEFTGKTNMMVGESYGIKEPEGDPFYEIDKIDLIVVPGVAFDINNNRLGRGKAYYDNLLIKTQALKVGVCFDFQLLDFVPVDEHDVKMDLVITDLNNA
jgi:5-formyltetrahydrofolate cyclo-ligase